MPAPTTASGIGDVVEGDRLPGRHRALRARRTARPARSSVRVDGAGRRPAVRADLGHGAVAVAAAARSTQVSEASRQRRRLASCASAALPTVTRRAGTSTAIT